MTAIRLDEVIKKGVSTGVFQYAPKSEDILTMLIGSALFVIRNKRFYEEYIPNVNDNNYLTEAEKKLRLSSYQTIFSLLGYNPEP